MGPTTIDLIFFVVMAIGMLLFGLTLIAPFMIYIATCNDEESEKEANRRASAKVAAWLVGAIAVDFGILLVMVIAHWLGYIHLYKLGG